MEDKKARVLPQSGQEHQKGDNLDVEWGENHQERILEKPSRSDSEPHRCKGPHCESAFEKL